MKPDGTPSVQLEWRLDCAVEVWQKKQVPIVVCGAKGKDEPEPEANAMKSYLMGKGVPEYMILTDPDSFNTEQNLAHAKKLLDEYQGEIGIFLDANENPYLPAYWLKNHSRESLAWVKYWLKKYLHLNL